MSLLHYSRVVWYQLVKPRLWQWSTAFVQPVPTSTAFRSLFSFRTPSDTQFIQSFRDAVRPRLLVDVATEGTDLRSMLLEIMSEKEIISQAHDILQGRFAVFSDTPQEFGSSIDWHRDYRSGYRWPTAPYHRIDFMSSSGSDMKFPCEVSKFHRLSWLGMAHLLTDDERYATKFALETTDWIQSNPVNTGINWTVPLEVAIRAVNWIQAYTLFHSAKLPDSFMMLFLRSLYTHGLFIEYNLEYVRVPGNHFACNCLGLIALGTFFRDTRAGRRWLALGTTFLEREILRQNTPDGVNFEKSVPYHRFVTEIYTLALLFAEKAESPFSHEYRARLEAMYGYMAVYMRPDGSAPMIGDADNGRILRFRAQEDFNNQADNLAVGAALFGREDFAAAIPSPSPDVLFTLGPKAIRTYPKAKLSASVHGQYFPDGGYIIHRSAYHHFMLDCGDYGKKGRGGHGHNDCLSFDLWIGGSAIISDSGTGVYTSNRILRDKLRSTRAHNTVWYKGKEQVEFAGVWKIKTDTTSPKILDLDADEQTLHLVAEQYGYTRSTNAIHRRSAFLRVAQQHGDLVISDEIIGADPLGGTSLYHFPPEVMIEQTGDFSLRGTCGSAVFTLRSDTPLALARAPYSPLYGVVGECTELCLPCNNTITLAW